MNGASLKAKAISAAVAVVAMLVVWPVQGRIDSMRTDLEREHLMPTQLPLSAAASAAMGGFRGIAVDILWIQADSMINDKQFYQLRTYYEIISVLQPNFPSVWEYNSWNLAFNIAAEWGRPDEKWIWIKHGIDFGEKGLIHNPDSVELHHWVGWIYFFKVGKDPYFSERFYQERGEDAYKVAAGHFERALELSERKGGTDLMVARVYAQSLLRQGDAVLARTGNVPEAMSLWSAAEEETERFLMEFPSDASLQKMLYEMRETRARFAR